VIILNYIIQLLSQRKINVCWKKEKIMIVGRGDNFNVTKKMGVRKGDNF
jgi:hypothetical protein